MTNQMHWLNGYSSDILIYARRGSWFGHQDKADSWPHLLVNTTIRRPRGLDWSAGEQNMAIQAKRKSAIVPKEAFKPLGIRKGETWGMYVCSSLDDIRYTHGSSNGQTFAQNAQLRIMEGAGAADYPPFFQGAEYTFHAPRVFNGILRYDHVAKCPSDAPSQYGLGISEVPSTVAATPNPTQAPSSNFYEAAAATSYPMEPYRTTAPTPIPIATTSVSPSEAPTIVKRQRVRSSSPSTTPNRLPKSDPYPTDDGNSDATGFPTLSPTKDDYISVAKNSPPESPEKQPNETPTFSFSGNKSTSEALVISNVVPIVVLAAGAVLLS